MHRLLSACCALVALLLLAACTISSDTQLLTDAEVVAPLPAHFILYPYDDSDTGYVRIADPPATFDLVGRQYVSSDMADTKGKVVARFVPLGSDGFLMGVTFGDDQGTAYAFARYQDGVLSMALSPSDATTAAITELRAKGTPAERTALDDLTVSGGAGGITVKSRAALDALGAAFASGRLPMSKPAVAFIGTGAAKPPSKLTPDGKGWKLTP